MTYITMSDIGLVGDLGSQIQQYFSLLALAKLNNKTLLFSKQSRFIGHGLKFFDLLDININIMENEDLKNFLFTEFDIETINLLSLSLLKLNSDINYALINSRFDLYKFWYNHKDMLEIDSINFKSHILEYANEYIEQYRTGKEIVSLHVRRGDYLLPQHSHYVQLDKTYYLDAINKLNLDNFKILIFSNDIPWCQENLNDIHEDIAYSVSNNDQADMCIMSLCDHNIIANSSFSWWGAYFNKNPTKKIVCPKNYLQNHPLTAIINEKYYPDDWIAI